MISQLAPSSRPAGAVEVTMQMFMSNKPSLSRISTTARPGLDEGERVAA